MRPPVELGVHRAQRCEPVVSLVRSRRAPPVPLIVLPKSCSCRWGPCPRPIPRLACLFSFFFLSGKSRHRAHTESHRVGVPVVRRTVFRLPINQSIPSLPWVVCFLSLEKNSFFSVVGIHALGILLANQDTELTQDHTALDLFFFWKGLARTGRVPCTVL